MSEDDLSTPTSDNFWEVGQYKVVTHRCDAGNEVCLKLVSYLNERAEIEATYARSLRQHASKWQQLLSKGLEFGTLSEGWRESAVEAQKLSEIHSDVSEKITQDVTSRVKRWQKEQYVKGKMSLGFKVTKELETAFATAQKPWQKKLAAAAKAKKDYHTAMKLERTARNKSENIKRDPGTYNDDDKSKATSKLEQSEQDSATARRNYETVIQELENMRADYMNDMRRPFAKSQQVEASRVAFFKDILIQAHSVVNIPADARLSAIYEEALRGMEKVDETQDTQEWSRRFGADMHLFQPAFEEYSDVNSAAKRHITSQKKNKGDVGVTLTTIKPLPDHRSSPQGSRKSSSIASSRVSVSQTHAQTPAQETDTSGEPAPKPYDDSAADGARDSAASCYRDRDPISAASSAWAAQPASVTAEHEPYVEMMENSIYAAPPNGMITSQTAATAASSPPGTLLTAAPHSSGVSSASTPSNGHPAEENGLPNGSDSQSLSSAASSEPKHRLRRSGSAVSRTSAVSTSIAGSSVDGYSATLVGSGIARPTPVYASRGTSIGSASAVNLETSSRPQPRSYPLLSTLVRSKAKFRTGDDDKAMPLSPHGLSTEFYTLPRQHSGRCLLTQSLQLCHPHPLLVPLLVSH